MITRAWIGKELEGFEKGEPTLFIEGLNIDGHEVIKLIESITESPPSRVYLGAGGKGLETITNYISFLLFTQKYNLNIMVELYENQYELLPKDFLSSNVINVTYSVKSDNVKFIKYFKLDTGKDVTVINIANSNLSTNSLEGLTDGLYTEDKLIYDKGEVK